jgi:hypothetical protein|tara:strand:- start:473 stop:1081 length:609 start_codon:yes stop_codon:yes gene_type:complete
MSVYAGAVQSGIGFASLAAGVDTAETAAAYNAAFQTLSTKIAASNARSAGERNISAVNQDKITSNTKIRQQQDEAEANAKVSAAMAGAKGASVDATIQQTEVNESHALAASNKAAGQRTEQLKAGIYNASMTLQSRVEKPKSSFLGDVLNAASSFEMSDITDTKAAFKTMGIGQDASLISQADRDFDDMFADTYEDAGTLKI